MTSLRNAHIVLPDEILSGSIDFDEIGIRSIGTTGTIGVDCEGDFILPGLVELHTDNVERHFMPRPRTYWPNHLAAVMAHDTEMAGSGITTVFDAISVGDYDGNNSPRRALFADMVGSVTRGNELDMFKASHFLHFRCELSDPRLMETLEPVAQNHKVTLASLMDHTPGQRQWRDLDALRTYMGRTGLAPAEIDRNIEQRIEKGSRFVKGNWQAVIDLFEGHNITLATHDDTTEEDIEQAVNSGIGISEFPCSLEAARHARKRGMTTIGGAPNIVRSGSHSGNVAVMDLAREDLLDALSSDYAPGSLLLAPFVMARELGRPLHETIKTVTAHPALMAGLHDRGEIRPGQRADLIRVRVVEDTPVVMEVYRNGLRVC